MNDELERLAYMLTELIEKYIEEILPDLENRKIN